MSATRLLALSTTIFLELYFLYHGGININRKLKLLHQILELIPTKPSQIIQKLKTHGNNFTLQICKGKIFAGEQCRALLNPNYKTVFSKLIDGEIRLRFSPQKILRVKEPSYLKITDDLHNINVFETHNTVVIPTKMLSIKPKSIFYNKIKGFFSKIKEPVADQLSYSLFGGQHLRQLILPEGSQCAILGKYIVEPSGVNCYQPLLIAPSKERMIAVIQQDLLGKKLLNIVLAIGAGFAIVLALKQIWNLIKKYKAKSNDFFEKINKIFLKSRVCSFCKKNMSCMFSQSCHHMSVCKDCEGKQGDECFQCKKKLKEIVQFFVC